MNISVEISLYPLAEGFLQPIKDFIRRLNEHEELTVETNAMSTQVFGPYERTLAIVAEEMQKTHRDTPRASFVIKVLNGDLRD